ncbi:MAG: DUF2283 domain-containing protein [Chloroflexi bacterium]|nr:DUF2283 domain-containing protein [Chloroflexota bacterium]
MVKQAKMTETERNVLNMEYEPEVDILTIYLKDPETLLSHSNEAEPGVILNYAKDGGLASVEVLDASRRYPASQLAACSVDEFIDLKIASGISSIAPVTLRTQAERGRLWALRLAGQWLTTRERLQQYMDSRGRRGKAVR